MFSVSSPFKADADLWAEAEDLFRAERGRQIEAWLQGEISPTFNTVIELLGGAEP